MANTLTRSFSFYDKCRSDVSMLSAPVTDLTSYVVSANASRVQPVDRPNYTGIVATNLRRTDSARRGVYNMRERRIREFTVYISNGKRYLELWSIANQIAPRRAYFHVRRFSLHSLAHKFTRRRRASINNLCGRTALGIRDAAYAIP